MWPRTGLAEGSGIFLDKALMSAGPPSSYGLKRQKERVEEEGLGGHFLVLFGVRPVLPGDRGGVGPWREALWHSAEETETILADFY